MAKKKKRRYKKVNSGKHRYIKKRTPGENFFLISLSVVVLLIAIACMYYSYTKYIYIIEILFLTGITVASFIYFARKRSGKKYLNYGFNKLNSLTGEEFEELLKAYFRKSGYKVELTPKSGDYGADLIVRKNGEKIIVQAKRYKGSVGISAVQEVIGAREYYKGSKALVITNSYFTPAAKELAGKTKVKLWDGKIVAEIIEKKHITGV